MKPAIKISILKMRHAYLLEDFSPLQAQPHLHISTICNAHTPAATDIILLPGSTDVAADYDELVTYGLDRWIHRHAEQGKAIFGICGGLQLMGQRLYDPEHHRYAFDEKRMLGLLDISTTFQKELIFNRLHDVSDPWGNKLRGFESHRGVSSGAEYVSFRYSTGEPLGYGRGKLLASYLHRCFHNLCFTQDFLEHMP